MDENRKIHLIFAWGLILLVSDLSDALLLRVVPKIPGWFPWGKIALLAAAVAACFVVKKLRALRPYALILFTLFLALRVSDFLRGTRLWQGSFGSARVGWTRGFIGIYVLDCLVAFAVIAVLLLLKRRRSECYLVKGDLGAPVEPVPWLGIRRGESWRRFGWIFAVVASAAVAVPALVLVHVPPGALGRLPALLPGVLAFAAINAFNEEVYFRASLLSTLKEVVGGGQAVLISAVFFGMAHYLYGSPAGIPGFLMTALLGWILGKSMIETRGLFWPWLIHFLPDVVVFLSYALTWIPN